MTQDEIVVLREIAKGHPTRLVTVIADGSSKNITGLTWEEVEATVQSTCQDIGEPIALLVQKGLIKMGSSVPSLLGRITGKQMQEYVFATPQGVAALSKYLR